MKILHISEIFSILGSISGPSEEEGYVHRFDAIDFEGGVWIVPSWLGAQDGTHRLPERIIGLHPTMLSKADEDSDVRYVVADPIPMSVLQGTALPQDGYTVLELPNIRVQIGSH